MSKYDDAKLIDDTCTAIRNNPSLFDDPQGLIERSYARLREVAREDKPLSLKEKRVFQNMIDGVILQTRAPIITRTAPSPVPPPPAFATPVNPLVQRIDNILARVPKNPFLESLKKQVLSGRRLTQKQLDALTKFEQPAPQATAPSPAILSRIDNLLRKLPNHPFLESLKKQVLSGRSLSQKQLDAIGKFEGTQQPRSRNVLSAEEAVTDLITNGNLDETEAKFVLGVAESVKRGTPLGEFKSKVLRNLFYRKQSMLRGTYAPDFQAQIRDWFGG